jgi:hypothetical protein
MQRPNASTSSSRSAHEISKLRRIISAAVASEATSRSSFSNITRRKAASTRCGIRSRTVAT